MKRFRLARSFSLPLAFLISSLALATAARADDTPTKVGPPQGHLMVVGGGNMAKLWAKFIELAGGPDAQIVLFTTAQDPIPNPDPAFTALQKAGAKHVTILHTRDPKEADTEAFVAPLKTATGVWFEGGRQWRLADSYLNTRTLKEIFAVLARGGTVGGTSAGASIQASYLVRGAPSGNTIMMSPGHEVGFALLRNTAVDQHVNTRERSKDILPVLQKHPELLGIALDEATGILVTRDQCEVLPGSAGIARFFATPDSAPIELKAGEKYDLAARKTLP